MNQAYRDGFTDGWTDARNHPDNAAKVLEVISRMDRGGYFTGARYQTSYAHGYVAGVDAHGAPREEIKPNDYDSFDEAVEANFQAEGK